MEEHDQEQDIKKIFLQDRENEISSKGTKNSVRKMEDHFKDQANKSVGRMPWHLEPMKDVISCEKLRGGANIH